MTWDSILLNINAVVCMLIMLRLMFFRRNGCRYRLMMAGIAYAIILAAGFIAFSIWFKRYAYVDPAEVILNIAICIAIWRADGNIARLVVRG